jgi:hypothetical protein
MFDLLEDLYNIACEVESDDFAAEMREIDEEVRRILGKGLSLESVRLAIEHSRLSPTQLDTGRDDPLLGTRRSKRLNPPGRPPTPAA